MSGCDWGGGGGGIRSLGGRTREVPCHSHGQRVRVPPASGASAHGLMGSTSVAGRPLAGRLSVCSAAGSDWLCDLCGVGGLLVSCSVPAVSVGGVVRPITLGTDAEHRLLTQLKAYEATSVQRLPSRQGSPSLAVRVSFACEALPYRVKVGLHVFEVTQYAACLRRCTRCKKTQVYSKIMQANQTSPRCGGGGGGVTGKKGVASLHPAQTVRAPTELPG